MPLRTLVKVSQVTNLSDARYCAGMGVDMLGFCVIEGQPNYISPKLFQEIRGWVAGPKVVAELYGMVSANEIESILSEYAPDFLELSATEFQKFKFHITLPCLVEVQSLPTLPPHDPLIRYIISHSPLENSNVQVLLKSDHKSSIQLINDGLKGFHGIVLSGSHETRPGFKSYEGLAEILEMLDE
jgi:phosphoribosylanthranilate isomerase